MMSIRVTLILLFACPIAHANEGLLGHWKLAGDVKDHSGNGLDGVNHGANLTATAARFDGRKAYVEVPAHKSLRLGKGDFTFAVWLHTEKELDDVIGDIISLYDPIARRGVTWCVKNSAGATNSQSNYRHVHFGIDSGTTPTWQDCGRPGNANYVMALAILDDVLYAGTCEPGQGESGHVYRYAGGEKWLDCGSPDKCNAITSLAVYEGKLYAGTGRYRLAGSSLPESENKNLGGKVFRYDGDKKWTACGQLPETEAVGGMVVFRGKLYASSLYKPAGLFRYAGGEKWERVSSPKGGERVVSLMAFNGHLYAGSYDACSVFRQTDKGWDDLGKLEQSGQTYSFEVHRGELFVGTWPNGRAFRFAKNEKWVDAGRLGDEKEVMGMAVYNGKLYAGTLPLAEVYRYDGDGKWTNAGRIDHSKDVRYRRAWTTAVHAGRLYFGTLPSGRVHALEAGKCVTYDRELAPGWRHLCAVKEGDRLKLYIDGKLEATSTALDRGLFDVSNDQALRIGVGTHDHLNGSLSDLRLYGRALRGAEVMAMAKRGK